MKDLYCFFSCETHCTARFEGQRHRQRHIWHCFLSEYTISPVSLCHRFSDPVTKFKKRNLDMVLINSNMESDGNKQCSEELYLILLARDI